MKPVKTKEEDLLLKSFLEDKMNNFEIVHSIRTKIDVMRKVNSSLRNTRPKPNNKMLNPFAISELFGDLSSPSKFKEIKPKTTTLPTTISQEVREAGIHTIDWTDIKDLPAGMGSEIRKMGDKIFESFGLKKGESVRTISSLRTEDLLNSNLELNSVLSFLEKNSTKVFEDPQTQIFTKNDVILDEYAPKIQLYNTNDKAYLVVFEPEGHGMESNYIYEFKRDLTLQLNFKDNKKLKSKPS